MNEDTRSSVPVAPPSDVVALSGRSLAWRGVGLLVGAAMAVLGTAVWDDGAWPFAPMSQFAFYVGPQSQIRATYVDARWTTGEVRPMQLTATGVGIARAEIEGRIAPIVEDPSILQDLAVRQRMLHPDEPQPVTLWLRQKVIALRDGRPAGTTVVTLAEWQVQP
jgi:hypothetical protein